MPMTLAEAVGVIESAGYALVRNDNRTTKTIEFVSPRLRRTLYLRLGQGFPRFADVNIHPDVPSATIATITGIKPGGVGGLRRGDSMEAFPEWSRAVRKNQHYARAFRADSLDALAALCREYDRVA